MGAKALSLRSYRKGGLTGFAVFSNRVDQNWVIIFTMMIGNIFFFRIRIAKNDGPIGKVAIVMDCELLA